MVNETALLLGTARSCIRELFEYGQSKLAAGETVYDFSLGNPSIPAPRQVQEALLDLLQHTPSLQLHGYTTAVGALPTRQAIGEELNSRYGAQVRAEDLFITCGAAPGLCAVFKALSGQKRQVIALCPYFPEYKPFAENAGLEFVPVEAKLPDFGLNLLGVEAAINENTVAVIVNSPNNPSGVIYGAEELQALAQLLTQKAQRYGHPIYIVSDEPYRELVYEGAEVPFLPAIYGDTIVCYSYSKSLSLPGERIGYIYVNQAASHSKELYGAIAGASRAMGHVCAPSLMQALIARCAQLGPDLQAYDKNRRALYEGLLALGYEMPKPMGAFYLFVKAPNGDGVTFSEKAKEMNLLVVPGEGFGCPGYFRLCYCVNYDTILGSLPLFQKLIQG